MTFVKDPCGIVCVLVTYMAVLYADYVVTHWIILQTMPNSLWAPFHVVAFNTIVFLLAMAHLKAVLLDPGTVPLPQIRIDFSDLHSEKNYNHEREEWTMCTRCETYRPPRAHHCRICKRCIRRMDHHCPWINNCVGERNQKYFLQFLLYVCALAVYSIFLIVISWLYPCEDCHVDVSQAQSRMMHSVLLLLESALFGLFVIAIMVDQMHAILYDETAVEAVQQKGPYRIHRPKMALLAEVCGRGHPMLWMLPCTSLNRKHHDYETSDGESGTLIHRFSRHVSLTKRDFTDKTKYGFKVSNFYPLPDVESYSQQIRNLATVDLAKLITFTTDFRSKADFRSYTEIVNALDEECVRRIQGSTTYELLEMLHCFMYLLPNKIAQLKSYQSAMPKLIELFGGGAENERDFLTIVFFLGMWKRNKTGSVLMNEFLQQYLDRYLTPQLSQMDFAILANASYKTSLRLAEESEAFKRRLVDEIVNFDNTDDPALMVTLIKCARMNRLASDEIVQKVRSYVQANGHRKELDFRGLAHLFAYIADNRIKDETLEALFVEGCWARFEQEIRTNGFETQSQSCRPKDIATFLWACGTLSVPMEATGVNFNMLEKAIRLKVEAGEYRYIPDVLVDTVLSLWICDRKSIGLFRLLFKDRALVQNLRKERAKIESRKDLLLSCAEIDLPEAMDMVKAIRKPGDAFVLDRPAPEFLVRPALQKVAECLNHMKKAGDLPLTALRFNLPVKNLNIAGILVQFANGVVVNLDVMDDKHCLSDGLTPVGLLKLKSRILEDRSIKQATVR
ncbi:hypothetical protein ZHAS_00006104 [Anopheles sinensis]|uniref:Palmitoyltransferase n=1 Tax=Anopheles sinensis TaxID=74873 RepID=A0A084VL59_ANOSI|nr:hypothetical protein ZHAS_00006104 [Anopheles sinensis]